MIIHISGEFTKIIPSNKTTLGLIMADAIISPLLQRLGDFIVQEIQNEVNLVTGVEEEIRHLSDQLEIVRNVLDDADRKRFTDKSVRGWLKRLESACCEMDDVLDEWDYNLLRQQMEKQSNSSAASKHKVCSFVPSPSVCLPFQKVSFHHRIGKRIKQVKVKLDGVLEEKGRYGFATGQPADPFGGSWRVQSTSFVKVETVCGRNDDKDILMTKLMPNDVSEETSGIQVISIVGVGGIGKTTLAQLVYNDSRVEKRYPLRIWICVSHPFDPAMIAKGIIQIAGGQTSPDTNQLDNLLKNLKDAIQGKKFLLVLDDVWTEDSSRWEPLEACLKYGAPGSKVLVTTRNERVARMMGTTENGIHRPRVLSDDDCWKLLSRIAFFDRSENECQILKEIGRKIADKCEGLPLAAKVMGSLLRFKNRLEDWENVLDSELWQLEEAEVDIFPHLMLTYNELTPTLKRCFSYCAIFPKDYEFNVEKDLIQNWVALGYLGLYESAGDLEHIGRDCFNNLAMRSLFQEFETVSSPNSTIKRCKMHDIVHDFAQFVKNDNSSGRIQASCTVCHSMVSYVKEYRCLYGELPYRPLVSYICNCLISLKVLHIREGSITEDIGKLIHLRHLALYDLPYLHVKNIKLICKLYNLKFLILSNCGMEEIPMEIRNLIGLRSLDLSDNFSLEELPEKIGDLQELRSLNIERCRRLSGLPQGILKLTKLKHLHVDGAFSGREYPYQVIGQLSGLHTLTGFRGKLSCLKKLNQLSGAFYLEEPKIKSGKDVVEATGAEFIKKVHVDELTIEFSWDVDVNVDKQVCLGVLDALEPHANLSYLRVELYRGSKLPDWISSPINLLKQIELFHCHCLRLLPPLGKLPCLERLQLFGLDILEFVGRDFLGITSSSSSSSSLAIGFPKLEIIIFEKLSSWKEWEDITAEAEDSTGLSLFPCLKLLQFYRCPRISRLPHRLLRKASSLEELGISYSPDLAWNYERERDDSSWKYVSHIPRLTISRF